VLAALFRRFAAFLYVGEANREYLRQHCVPADRLFFSPHAVDNDRFAADLGATRNEALVWRRELGIPQDRQVILFVGKFEDKKRPTDLIEAFAHAKLPRAALLLVGNGHLEPQLREAAARVQHVYFAPFQNQSKMPRTYAAGDVLVLPSLGPHETWGLCVNEAMCLGKPVIVSSHVGCGPDLVKHGKNGFVFPAGDIDALADCLREITRDPERIPTFGAGSRELIKGYGYRQATDGLLAALNWIASR
jgi:glycosyltransferase involved in cell wall biosynthesis